MIEFRAARLDDVRFKQRQIDLVVMPYEQETVIHEPGRTYTEIVSRGAFDGVEKRTSRIRVNFDHSLTVRDTVGRAVELHPGRPDGLVATVKIFEGSDGDHALESAAGGGLDASAGFQLLIDEQTGKVKQGAEVWETRSRRRLNHLFLHHIALTPDGAYENANVLAVRAMGEPTPTPVRDRLRHAELEALLADMDKRYGIGA